MPEILYKHRDGTFRNWCEDWPTLPTPTGEPMREPMPPKVAMAFRSAIELLLVPHRNVSYAMDSLNRAVYEVTRPDYKPTAWENFVAGEYRRRLAAYRTPAAGPLEDRDA